MNTKMNYTHTVPATLEPVECTVCHKMTKYNKSMGLPQLMDGSGSVKCYYVA
jgi:hypothetical protein